MSPIAPDCSGGGGSGPAGFHDWEVNQLCDFDVDGNLIATFLQLFQWDEATSTLVITLVRADDPTIPYVPTGTVQACAADDGPTNDLLTSILTQVTAIDSNTNDLEALVGTTNTTLTSLLTAAKTGDFDNGQNPDIDIAAPEQVVVGGGSHPANHGVIVKALPTNTGTVYVGDSAGVTTATGFPLEAGETVSIPVDDADKVWVATDTDNQGVAWIAA